MIIIFILCISSLSYILINSQKGDYIISEMWIGNNSENSNIQICNNCLWIKFYEGCNRYSIYYFENEHNYNEKLKIDSPVQIYFIKFEGKNYISHIESKKFYRGKC